MLRVLGKVKALRIQGKRLVFIDLVHDDVSVQVMCNLGMLEKKGYQSSSVLERFRRRIHVGDYYGMLQVNLSQLCVLTLPQSALASRPGLSLVN
jgi:hypothetical protein